MNRFFVLLSLSLATLCGQAPDYFPLVPGSQWVYRGRPFVETLKIRVEEQRIIEGKTYYRLSGYSGEDLLVRRAEDGNYVYWKAETKTDEPFLRFDGRPYNAPAFCAKTGQSAEKEAPFTGPIGYFDRTLSIGYTGGVCSDAGTTNEVYAPWLGMVQRTVTSFTGPRNFDLVYAQIGGITFLSESAISFGLSLTPLEADGKSANVAVRLVLTNNGKGPVKLEFASSQLYDFIVRNEKGEVVYTWSSARVFLQSLSSIEIPVKGEQVWQETFTFPTLGAGKYSIEAKLSNTDGNKFSAVATVMLP